MFHWICPECGREIPPAVKECPSCDLQSAPAAPLETSPQIVNGTKPETANGNAPKPAEESQKPVPIATLRPAAEPLPDPLLNLAQKLRDAQKSVAATPAPPPPLILETKPAVEQPRPAAEAPRLATEAPRPATEEARPVAEPAPVVGSTPEPAIASLANLQEITARDVATPVEARSTLPVFPLALPTQLLLPPGSTAAVGVAEPITTTAVSTTAISTTAGTTAAVRSTDASIGTIDRPETAGVAPRSTAFTSALDLIDPPTLEPRRYEPSPFEPRQFDPRLLEPQPPIESRPRFEPKQFEASQFDGDQPKSAQPEPAQSESLVPKPPAAEAASAEPPSAGLNGVNPAALAAEPEPDVPATLPAKAVAVEILSSETLADKPLPDPVPSAAPVTAETASAGPALAESILEVAVSAEAVPAEAVRVEPSSIEAASAEADIAKPSEKEPEPAAVPVEAVSAVPAPTIEAASPEISLPETGIEKTTADETGGAASPVEAKATELPAAEQTTVSDSIASGPTPIEASPVEVGTVEGDPIEAGPIAVGAIDAGPTDLGAADPVPANTNPVEARPVEPVPVDPGPPDPATAGRIPTPSRVLPVWSASSTPLEVEALPAEGTTPTVASPALVPTLGLAPLQSTMSLGRRIRPASPEIPISHPENTPRITLPAPALPAVLNSLQAAGIARIVTERPKTEKKQSWGWAIAMLAGGVIVAAVLGLTLDNATKSTASTQPTPSQPVNATSAVATSTAQTTQPAAGAVSAASYQLSKAVEVTGFRIVGDKKSEVHYLVVNHAGVELSTVTVYVTLRASNAKPGQPPLGKFSFRVPALGPFESKEMVAGLDKPLKLPTDWQSYHADIELGQ